MLHPRERALLVTEEKQSTGSSSLIRRWGGGHAVRASLLRLEEKPELCRLGLRLCSMPSVCEDFRSGLRPRSDGEDLSEVERGRGSWRCQLWSVVGLPGGPRAQPGVGGGGGDVRPDDTKERGGRSGQVPAEAVAKHP